MSSLDKYEEKYELIRWDAPFQPTLEKQIGILKREGWSKVEVDEFEPGHQTPEIRLEEPSSRMVVQGTVQLSFPGYGVVELHPGDQVNLSADALYDITVKSPEPAVILLGLRKTK